MAFEIVKVTNCGIKLTTGAAVPVIRIIVSGDPAGTDVTAFYTAAAALAKGCVAVATVYGATVTVPGGTTGNNTGFAFEVAVDSNGKVTQQRLFYKGNFVGCAKFFTGYSSKETSYLTIVTDEDGNLYKFAAGLSNSASIFLLNTVDPGTVARGSLYTAAIVTNSPLQIIGASFLQTTPVGENVSDLIINEISTDPFEPAGESQPAGWGDGDFDFSSTDIPIPSLPSIGASNTGFSTLYAPSATQLRSLASYLWSGTFDPANLRKIVANPMDVIMGLYIIPTVTGHPATTSAELIVGNISSGISMPQVTEQYFEVDCGTITIPNKWGSYLDYSPYSKLSLYLPYIGYLPISADDCMGGSISVKYHVDIVSGTCVAFVYCVSNRGRDGHTLYTYEGSCATQVPVTAGQYATVFDMVSNVAGAAASLAMGNPRALSEVQNAVRDSVSPEVTRSGDFGGSGGLMSIQYPYLILTAPRMAMARMQNTYIGYPSFVTKQMGDLQGYTELQVNHLNNMTATDAEIDEILRLLAEGVIF